MKTVIRLTESELRKIVEGVTRKIVKDKLNEDVLGDNWHEAESEETPFNNYEPFEDQMDTQDNHNMSSQGEVYFDPTYYEDYDKAIGWDDSTEENYMDDEDPFPDDHIPTDNELYHFV